MVLEILPTPTLHARPILDSTSKLIIMMLILMLDLIPCSGAFTTLPVCLFTAENIKGDEILYPVNDYRDQQWARAAKRLDWVVERHLPVDSAKDKLEELHTDYIDVLWRSQKACSCTISHET